MFTSSCIKESRTTTYSAMCCSLIGFLGCDLMVSGLIGLPFS